MQETRTPARLSAKVLLGAYVLAALVTGAAQAADDTLRIVKMTAALVVRIDGIPREGTLVVGLYDEASYPAFSLIRQTVSVRQGAVSVTFAHIPPGTYAIRAFLDGNRNGTRDAGEPEGVSNDAKTPEFDAAALVVMGPQSKAILHLHED